MLETREVAAINSAGLDSYRDSLQQHCPAHHRRPSVDSGGRCMPLTPSGSGDSWSTATVAGSSMSSQYNYGTSPFLHAQDSASGESSLGYRAAAEQHRNETTPSGEMRHPRAGGLPSAGASNNYPNTLATEGSADISHRASPPGPWHSLNGVGAWST
jgi:hypothetical protein